MSDQLLVVGFLVLVALQLALHVRLAKLPRKAGTELNLALLHRAGSDARAIREGAAASVREIVESLEQYRQHMESDHRQMREGFRETLAVQADLGRQRGAQLEHLVELARALRDASRRTQHWERTLGELVGARVPVLRPPPVPHPALPEPTGDAGQAEGDGGEKA